MGGVIKAVSVPCSSTFALCKASGRVSVPTRKYQRFFLFPYQQTSDGESAKHIHFPDSPIYVAPAASADEALALMGPYLAPSGFHFRGVPG